MGKYIKKYNSLPIQVKASLWALVCGVLNKGVQVITTPIFTRILTTDEYGRYNVFNSWLQILTIVIALALHAGVFDQGLVKFESEKKVLASSMQGLTLTLVTLWSLVYILFRNFWNGIFDLSTVQMLAMLLMIWLTAAYNFWAAEQKNEYRYKALVAVTISVAVLSPTTSILFILNSDDKVTARILGALIIEAVVYVWLFFVQLKNGKKFFSKKFWKYALLFNLPLVPHYLSQVVLSGADRIMIEKMVGESEAGIYSLAYSLSMMMIIFNTALMQSLSPWIYRKIKAKDIKSIAPVAYTSLLGIAVLNLLLICFAPEAVKIFAPPQYYDAIRIIPPVAISVFYIYSYDLFAKFAFYFEKRAFITIASVIGAALNIILNFFCIRSFGYLAAGYTTLACYIIYALGHYIFMNRVCKKFCNGETPYNGKIILAISSVFTVSGLALLLTYNHAFIRYTVVGVAAVAGLIMHRTIINQVKKLLSLRKNG